MFICGCSVLKGVWCSWVRLRMCSLFVSNVALKVRYDAGKVIEIPQHMMIPVKVFPSPPADFILFSVNFNLSHFKWPYLKRLRDYELGIMGVSQQEWAIVSVIRLFPLKWKMNISLWLVNPLSIKQSPFRKLLANQPSILKDFTRTNQTADTSRVQRPLWASDLHNACENSTSSWLCCFNRSASRREIRSEQSTCSRRRWRPWAMSESGSDDRPKKWRVYVRLQLEPLNRLIKLHVRTKKCSVLLMRPFESAARCAGRDFSFFCLTLKIYDHWEIPNVLIHL